MPTSTESRTTPESFQLRANVERFRLMLSDGNFARSQRDMIEDLLAKEEAKLAAAIRPADRDR